MRGNNFNCFIFIINHDCTKRFSETHLKLVIKKTTGIKKIETYSKMLCNEIVPCRFSIFKYAMKSSAPEIFKWNYCCVFVCACVSVCMCACMSVSL